MSLLDSPQHRHAAQAAAAQCRGEPGARPASARRRAASGRPTTWAGYRDQVRDFALGLAALGFKRGDKLSVVGDNRPQLYLAQLAAQVLGGMSVPVYQDSIATELVYVLEPRRDLGDRRRGPGAGRQGPVAARTSCRTCA